MEGKVPRKSVVRPGRRDGEEKSQEERERPAGQPLGSATSRAPPAPSGATTSSHHQASLGMLEDDFSGSSGRDSGLTMKTTMISTTSRKNGRSRRAKLDDLDSDELEDYIKDKLKKKQITTKNAFAISVIDCQTAMLNRPTYSQSTRSAEAGTEVLKNQAIYLECGATIYDRRVENTYRATNELSDDLTRALQGKSIKGRKKQQDDDEEGEPGQPLDKGEKERDQEVDDEDRRSEDGPAKSKRGRKKAPAGRKSHCVKSEELACTETDTNANLISRFWTLIGNVQPGAMKDTWIHNAERIEKAGSVEYVMDPDMSCFQRYNAMLRGDEVASMPSNQGVSTRMAPKKLTPAQREVLRTAEESFTTTAHELMLRQSNKVSGWEDCVVFPRPLERRLAESAKNAAKKQPRLTLPRVAPPSADMAATLLERTCRQLSRGGCLFPPKDEEMVELTDSVAVEERRESSEDAVHVDQYIVTSPDRMSERGTEVDEVGSASAAEEVESSVADLSTMARTATPPIEDDDPDPTPAFRTPLTPSISSSSRAGSVRPSPYRQSVERSSRYGSVMKELNQSVSGKRSVSVTSDSVNASPRKKVPTSWPERFALTPDDVCQHCYNKVAKSSRKRTTTKEREGSDSLLDYPTGLISTAAMVQNIRHPASFRLDNILQTLAIQTKALTLNLKKQKDWLPSDNQYQVSIDEMLLAFGRAYDEDFDKERLIRQWGDNPLEQNYDLDSDDESEEEDNGEDEEDIPLPEDRETHSVLEGSPTPLVSCPISPPPASNSEKNAAAEESHLLEASTTLGGEEGWTDQIVPLEKKIALAMNNQLVDKVWPELDVSATGSLGGISGEGSQSDNGLLFAENIALKDLTGSGINISRMKNGVQKAYGNLLRWRAKYVSVNGSSASVLPYLTIQHLMDAVPLYLGGKDLPHVNPSVILSCLLHLAYERHRNEHHQKLYLCNSEDLRVLYLMTKDEYEEYTKEHPHLNHLTKSYASRLLKMKLPLSKSEEVVAGPSFDSPERLQRALSLMSVSDSDDHPEEGEEEEGGGPRVADVDMSDSD